MASSGWGQLFIPTPVSDLVWTCPKLVKAKAVFGPAVQKTNSRLYCAIVLKVENFMARNFLEKSLEAS